ncbi:hypothetical protein [Paracoccus luteus]|uniref:hypothetical protein n=1 Tax=Paracoccus luteus TaxID=2508543 RepID=UPI00106F1E89|nr:hypothetical protein [Paracoccus luteus]
MTIHLTEPLVTVRPGPVLHGWQDGQQVVAVHLGTRAALIIAADLLRATSLSMSGQQGSTTKEGSA